VTSLPGCQPEIFMTKGPKPPDVKLASPNDIVFIVCADYGYHKTLPFRLLRYERLSGTMNTWQL